MWFSGGVCLLRARGDSCFYLAICFVGFIVWVWLCARPEKGVLKRDG
jgi:hypothetical protein